MISRRISRLRSARYSKAQSNLFPSTSVVVRPPQSRSWAGTSRAIQFDVRRFPSGARHVNRWLRDQDWARFIVRRLDGSTLPAWPIAARSSVPRLGKQRVPLQSARSMSFTSTAGTTGESWPPTPRGGSRRSGQAGSRSSMTRPGARSAPSSTISRARKPSWMPQTDCRRTSSSSRSARAIATRLTSAGSGVEPSQAR
jgi:hypothetical protein